MVAYLLPKQTVEGSNPFTRSAVSNSPPNHLWLTSRKGVFVYRSNLLRLISAEPYRLSTFLAMFMLHAELCGSS